MNLPSALNIYFGSALILILVFAECVIKYSSDRILKKIFCIFLVITFLSLIIDIIFSSFQALNAVIIIENITLKMIINFFPIISALLIIIHLSKKYIQMNGIINILLIIFFFSMGLNILAGSVKIIWPLMAALLLYTYLFIIIKENRIDNLTGLGNRYSFFEYFNRISRNKAGETWAIAMLDISNFKSINDIYGHLEGDNALLIVSNIIRMCTRKTDFTARYGGDEFILVTREENNINSLIENIKNELSKFNENSGKLYNLEISSEFDTFTADGSRAIDDFFNHTDMLMHKNTIENRRAGDTIG